MTQIKKMRHTKSKFPTLSEKLLLRDVHVLDPSEKLDARLNVIIIKGKIAAVGKDIPDKFDGEIIAADGALLLPGMIDMHVHLREPGREDEETIESGTMAAANGGFTAVACMPNTEPAIDTQEVVNFIKEEAKALLVDVHPVAAITKAREGKELAPIAEMAEAGAVGISDDGSPVMNAELMRRALEYSKMFDIPVLGHEEDSNLSKNRHMHEGFYSTKLGLPGIPSVSEEIMVARDIMLTEYTGGKFHICHISTRGSLELVRQAKSKGVPVTCEVTPHHFTLTDQAVESFDTNTKMNPPLRSADDLAALREGLRDGTIDAIASDHAPHSIEEKEAEYIYAPFGIIGLETGWGLIVSELLNNKIITLKDIYRLCVANPRQILNLPVPKIKAGEMANLSLLDLNTTWRLSEKPSYSRSKNSPFGERMLKGRALAVINKGMIFRDV